MFKSYDYKHSIILLLVEIIRTLTFSLYFKRYKSIRQSLNKSVI